MNFFVVSCFLETSTERDMTRDAVAVFHNTHRMHTEDDLVLVVICSPVLGVGEGSNKTGIENLECQNEVGSVKWLS